jgi:hypothetical protein
LLLLAKRENRFGAGVNRPAYAVWYVVHIDLSGGFDVFVAQDSLSVFHSAVLLEVGAQRATENLERAELPGNLKRVRDGPYFPFEEVLGAERDGIALVPEVPFRWEHQGIRRGVWTNLAPSFDVGAHALRNGDTGTAVFGLYLPFVQLPFIGGVVDDEVVKSVRLPGESEVLTRARSTETPTARSALSRG